MEKSTVAISDYSPHDNFSNDSGGHEIPLEHRHASWITVALLEISDVIGIGILAMGVSFAILGWILGVVVSVICITLCVYVSILQWQVRNIYVGANSQPLMAKYVFKNRFVTILVGVILYSMLMQVAGSKLIILGRTLGAMIGNMDICGYQYIAMACALLIPLCQLRNLASLEWFLRFNCLFILAAITICVGFVLSSPDSGQGKGTDESFPSEMTVERFFSGVAFFAFSYCGLILYLEMISEMTVPSDFPKTFLISAPVEFILCMIVATISYWYQGEHASDLLELLPRETAWYRVVNALLFCYILVAYTMTSVILTRTIHKKISPATYESRKFRGTFYYFMISLGIMTTAYLLATVIPVFSIIVGFAGSIQTPILGYLLPIVCIAKARYDHNIAIRYYEWAIWIVVTLFSIALIVFGTISNVQSLSQTYSNGTVPFSCH